MQPKVSIIVPCWGVEKYLDKCIESLVNQKLQDIEIILVDDVSPDRVPEMCDEWAKKDSRIKVIHKQKNEGLGFACNTGLDDVTGEYVAFCDSDDWIDNDGYEKLYSIAIAHNADAVFSKFRRVDIEGQPYSSISLDYKYAVYDTKKNITFFMKEMIAAHPSTKEDRKFHASAKVVLYKSNVIKKHNLRFVSEREMISEDLVFNFEFLNNAHKIVIVPETFYNYRSNPSSISHHIPENGFEQCMKLYKYLKDKLFSFNIEKDGLYRIQRIAIGYSRGLVSRVLNAPISISAKRKYINNILNNPIWKEIDREYPKHLMPIKHRLFYEAMIHKNIWILKVLSRFVKY